MPLVFAQVRHNAIASGSFTENCTGNNLWLYTAPQLPQGCGMIYIYT